MMTLVDAFLVGAVVALSAGAIVWFSLKAIRRSWAMLLAIEIALREVPKVRKASEDVARIIEQLVIILTGTGLPPTRQALENAAPEQVQTGPATFPAPVFERFVAREVPDATPEDTVVIAEDDAEMSEFERLDRLRQAGYAAEEPEHIEGIGGSV